MMDHVKALGIVLASLVVVYAFVAFVTNFPTAGVCILSAVVLALAYHSALTTIRSNRKLDEMRAKYDDDTRRV